MRNEFENQEAHAAGTPHECLWMLAGVLDYKLCDRGYDCDSCPLDRAFREAAHCHKSAQTNIAESEPDELQGYSLSPGLFYHPTHLWARIEDEGTVRVGLDDFAQSLTGRIYAVDLPEEGAKVDSAHACWRVATTSGEAALASPVSGTIQQVNPKLAVHPSLINRDPYGEGWVLIVKPSRLEHCLKHLCYGHKAASMYQSDIERLYQAVTEALPESPVGVTMQDGGSRIKDFTSLLTADQMRQLIDSFLSVPSTALSAKGKHKGR